MTVKQWFNGIDLEFEHNYHRKTLVDGEKFSYLGDMYRINKLVYGGNGEHVSYSISRDEFFGSSMNIERVSKRYVSLYTYDMMGQRTNYKMKLEIMYWELEITTPDTE